MSRFDLPHDEVIAYAPALPEPSDLDAFWATTLAEASARPLDVLLERVDTGLLAVESFDVTYAGFGGDPIRAWLHLPARALRGDEPLTGVAQFQGYGGGRGLAHENVFWALAGYAHLVMDTRGQGSGWSVGDTPDPVGSGPAQPGVMTRGIDDPHDYYYRRLFTDAVRAIHVLRGHDLVDAARVAITGASQGGGITLAVAALLPDVAAVMVDVPFLCDFRRATEIVDSDPYGEIVRYLKAHRDRVDRVFDTLSYFDGAVLARRATAPAVFSVALMDETCPPSTVYAAYNAYAGPKEIVEYPFNDHEGGQGFNRINQLRWLAKALGGPDEAPGRAG